MLFFIFPAPFSSPGRNLGSLLPAFPCPKPCFNPCLSTVVQHLRSACPVLPANPGPCSVCTGLGTFHKWPADSNLLASLHSKPNLSLTPWWLLSMLRWCHFSLPMYAMPGNNSKSCSLTLALPKLYNVLQWLPKKSFILKGFRYTLSLLLGQSCKLYSSASAVLNFCF